MRLRSRCRAFSLVEIMVGMVIALIGILVIMQVFALSEGRKRTTTAGSDAQTSGNMALFALERDLRLAGYGMNTPAALGCTINYYYNGTQNPGPPANTPLTLAPVRITTTAGAPDQVTLLYSTQNNFSMPATVRTSHPPTATNIFLDSNLGINVGDLVVMFEAGKTCTLVQITQIPAGNVQVIHQGGAVSPWNPTGAAATALYPAGGYGVGATMFNFGTMANRAYSIDTAKYNLRLQEISGGVAGTSSQTSDIASDIVDLKAQYGKDTTGPADGVIDTWDDVLPANATQWQQVIAVRLALVARSAQYEKPSTPGGPCTATTVTPTWSGSAVKATAPTNPTAKPLAVPGGVPSCYRYKVFETVVPLRNMIWGQS